MTQQPVTWWQLIRLLDAADRAWYHVDMLSLLAQILLEILHKVQRVWFFLPHWKKVTQTSSRRLQILQGAKSSEILQKHACKQSSVFKKWFSNMHTYLFGDVRFTQFFLSLFEKQKALCVHRYPDTKDTVNMWLASRIRCVCRSYTPLLLIVMLLPKLRSRTANDSSLSTHTGSTRSSSTPHVCLSRSVCVCLTLSPFVADHEK